MGRGTVSWIFCRSVLFSNVGSKDGEHCGGSFHCCWGSDVGHYGNADHRLHPVPVYNGDEAVLWQGQVRRKQVNKKRWFFRCVIFFFSKKRFFKFLFFFQTVLWRRRRHGEGAESGGGGSERAHRRVSFWETLHSLSICVFFWSARSGLFSVLQIGPG